MKRRLVLPACALLILAGCTVSPDRGAPLVPDKAVRLTSAFGMPLADAVSGAAALVAIYYIYDPLAPNWEIEESRLSDDSFRLSLRMKRYLTGGAGEPMQIFKRRAAHLNAQLGYAGYQLLDYSEGIDSETLGARRVAQGTIRLVDRQSADSFQQNRP